MSRGIIRRGVGRKKALTLLELLVCLAILALLLSLTRLTLDGVSAQWRLRSAAHEVENVLRMAQNAAATTATTVQVLYDVPAGEFYIRMPGKKSALAYHKLPAGVSFKKVRFASGQEVLYDVAEISASPDGMVDAHEVLIEGAKQTYISLVFERLTGDVSYEESTGNPPANRMSRN